jgi:hypothetical protein
MLTITAAFVAMTAQAIPLSELHAQAQKRRNIEAAINSLQPNCSCEAKREQIVADLRNYIARMKANIAFCKRYAAVADADEQKGIAKAIADYEAQIAWAEQAMKQVQQQ